MLARKVTLNPTLYEEWGCSDKKVTLIFYKRIRLELIVYLLQLCFFIIPDLLATRNREKDSAVMIRRFYFQKNFSHFSRVLQIFL